MRVPVRFVGSVLALLLISPVVVFGKTVTMSAADNRTAVSLNLGDTLVVELASGTVNGFQWNAHLPTPSALTAINEEEEAGDGSGPRLHRFRFNAAMAGDLKLVIGFESDVKIPGVQSGDASAFSAMVHVDPGVPRPGTAVLFGVYKGMLPCADCSGLETTLRLYAKGRFDTTYAYFVRTQTYVGAPHGDVTFSDRGEWSMERGDATDADATVYRLNPDSMQRSESLLVQEGGATLLQLGRDGRQIDTKTNLTLRRVHQSQ